MVRWIMLPVVVALVGLLGGAEVPPSAASQDAGTAGSTSLLAFASLTKEPLGYLGDLLLVRSDGQVVRPLRITGARDTWDETSPAWSPNGRRIAFSLGSPLIHASAIQLSPYDAVIAVVPAAGGRAQVVTETERGVIDDSPSWSPDGRSIAFVRTSESGGYPGLGLYVVRADGKRLRRLIERDGIVAVDWSPDGRSLAFVTGFIPMRVGTIELETGAVKEFRSRRPTDVSWSPDGREFALASDDGVTIVAPAGKAIRRVFGGCCATHVDWSTDGRRIAFSAGSRRNEYREAVYVVDADGRHLKRIVGGRSSYAPAWRPD